MPKPFKKERTPSYGFTPTGVNSNEDVVDQYSEETSWKSILLYQYQLGYIIFICLTIYGAILIVLTQIIFELVNPTKFEEGNIVYEADVISLFDFIYGVDVAQRIFYKITPWANQKLYNEESIAESLAVDIISVIPIEIIHGLTQNDVHMFKVLRLRVVLRLIRLLILDSCIQKYFKTQGTVMVICRIMCMKLFLTHLLTLLIYYKYCTHPGKSEGECLKGDYMMLVNLFYTALRITLTAAPDQTHFEVHSLDHLYVIINLLFQIYTFYLIAKLCCIKIESQKAEFKFTHNYSNVMSTYNYWKKNYKSTWNAIDKEINYAIKNYYSHFLRQRNGVLWHKSLLEILPDGLTKAITVDAGFDALMHSHIFRNEDDHVLRFIASLMKFEFTIPGEIIIKRGILQGKMIYVSHGVIQILSQEDGETPVLNLSGGTCIGETSLFFPKPSPCTIISQTYCEFSILCFEDFRNLIYKYPTRYRKIQKDIINRFQKAKRIVKIVENYLAKNNLSHNDILIMSWIGQFKNYIWNAENINEEQMMSKDRLFHYIDNMIFYVEHLDKLVVPDEVELITDTVFIKPTCHFILKPDSPLLFIWDLIVLLVNLKFVLMYPYLIAFGDEKYDSIEAIFSIIVSSVFAMDVYIQIFTAVKTRGATLITPSDIIIYRAQDIYFILDFIAALPIDLLILVIAGKVKPNLYMMFQSNRLMKYYKIIKFIKKANVHMDVSLTYSLQLLQICINGFFIFYYTTCIILILNCPNLQCNPHFVEYFNRLSVTTTLEKFAGAFSMALCLLTSYHFGDLPIETESYSNFVYILTSIIFYIYTISFYSDAIAYSALRNLPDLRQQESLNRTISALKTFEISKEFYDKIIVYLNQVWYIRDKMFSDNSLLSKELKLCYMNIHFMRFFEKVQIFKQLPYYMLSNLCSYVKRRTLPADQVVYYAGEICNEFCIIEEGFCTLTCGKYKVKTVEKYGMIGFLELLLKYPQVHTSKTVSDCIILQIERDKFENYLCKYPMFKDLLHSTLEHMKFDKLLRDSSDEDSDTLIQTRQKALWHYLIRKSNLKIKQWTIPATGSVVFYWEITRCFIAYANMLLSIYYEPDNIYKDVQTITIFIFDFISLVDITLRFFITYYDSNGIEITNLKKTSKHYLTHAFFIDIIGAIPFDLYFDGARLFTRINRCVYFYRIHSLINHLTDRIKKIRFFYYTSYFLEIIYIFHLLAFLDNYINCTYSEGVTSKLFEKGLVCDANSWISLSQLERPLTDINIFFESLLLMVSTFCSVGFRRIVLGDWFERLKISIWAVFGYFLKIIFISKAVSHVLFMNADLTQYQQAMNNLVVFLSYCKIDKNLKFEVINYFEYIWETRMGKNVKDVINNFSTALKQDTLYDIYGSAMRSCSIFNKAEKSMIKELLMFAKRESIRKTGILYRVNDIHGTIFYLLKGHVEVVGPDHNTLRTLPPGSIFGCLDDVPLSRHTLLMVAQGHVETLTFPSTEFHRLLRKYPSFRRTYQKLTCFNTDFLVGRCRHSHTKRTYAEPANLNSTYAKKTLIVKFGKIIYPTRTLFISEVCFYTIAFCFGGPWEILLHVINPSFGFLFIAYLHDILWIIRIYLKFHMAYEDEYGMMVNDRKKIAKRYIKSKTGFYLDLITNFPLDIIAVIIYRPMFIRLLRINRFFRAFHLFNHMRKEIKKLNINVLVMRTLYTLMYLYFYIQLTALLIYINEAQWKNEDTPMMKSFHSILQCVGETIYIITGTCNHAESYEKIEHNVSIFLAYLIIAKIPLLVYMYSSFASTLQIVTKTFSKYQSECSKINTFMNFTDASLPIVDTVQIYLSLLLKVKNGIQFPFLLEEAPYYLREAVLNSMFGFHLRNHHIFKNCHIDFVRQLSANMRTLTFFENNKVVYKGDNDGCMYFIHEGIISMLIEDTLYKETCAGVLKEGDCFGLNQVLYDYAEHKYTYKVEKLTIVVYFRKKDFRRLLQFFPAAERHIYAEARFLNQVNK